MIEVREMDLSEARTFISQVGFGHLGCCKDDRPYVVPVHYVYEMPYVYLYTTEGKKYEIIRQNPNVCLQVEEIADETGWKSAILTGKAEQVTNREERERIVKLITTANPTLTPAISIRWIDNWVRENREVIYKIEPETISGRYSVNVRTRAAFVQPMFKGRSPTN